MQLSTHFVVPGHKCALRRYSYDISIPIDLVMWVSYVLWNNNFDWKNMILKGDYRLLLSNFVLDITFKRIQKYIRVYVLESEFYKKHIGNFKF